MLRSTIRTLVANALWLATTVVQVVAWLYQLLAAAGLNLWLRTCGGIVVFSMVLLPGFLSVAWRLATKPESVLVHDLQYGTERRQYVDVYLPQRGTGAARLRTQKQGTAEAAIAPSKPDGAGGGAPVVLFLAGGGWTIGYKYWGAGIGFRLAARGVLVVCADYRQFPQTSVSGMLEDVQLALKWTVRNAARFGDTPSNTRGRPSPVDGADSDLDELDEAGKPGLASPLSGEGSTAWPSLGSLEDGDGPSASDPTAPAGERPLIAFLHGTDDTVAALSQAKELHATLTSAGWPSALGVYEAGTHTGPLIEDAMSDGDYLLEDLTDICRHVSAQVSPEGSEPTVVFAPGTRGVVAAGKVRAGKPGFPAFGAHVEPRTRLSFPVCIAIAKAVNPF